MVAIGVALVVVGCADWSDVVFGDVVSGNADTVSVKASYGDPGPEATRHCAKYGKIAVLESVTGAWWRWVGGSNIYVFKCR